MDIASSAILTYHSIDDSGSVISVSPDTFRSHMSILAASGVAVVPLDRLDSYPGSVAITFDDGFRNFTDGALPVLWRYGFPATVFVVSDYCGKQNDWPSQPPGIPRFDLMDWAELREAAQHGIALGGHTATHPRLSGLTDAELRREFRASRAKIEERTGAELTAFAYPYGDSDARVRRAVAAEYRVACGTALRFLHRHDDIFNLPRIDAYYLRNDWTMRHLFGAGGRAYIRARGWIRTARTAMAG